MFGHLSAAILKAKNAIERKFLLALQRKLIRQHMRKVKRHSKNSSYPYQSKRQIARTTRQFALGQLPDCAYASDEAKQARSAITAHGF